MAKLECPLHGDFYTILNTVNQAVIGKSVSASVEDTTDFVSGDTHVAVRVYERFSYLGNNRVSMNVTLIGTRREDGTPEVYLSAITSGGSGAVFFKINTFGESAFLDTIRDAVDRFRY